MWWVYTIMADPPPPPGWVTVFLFQRDWLVFWFLEVLFGIFFTFLVTLPLECRVEPPLAPPPPGGVVTDCFSDE